MNKMTLLTIVLSSLVASTAGAQEVSASAPVYERGGMFGTGIVVGLKAGGAFGAPFNEFSTAVVAELELGWVVLPFPDLQLFLTTQYTNPSTEGEGLDTRLPGFGLYNYEVKTEQLVLTPGLLYRIPAGPDWFRAYVGAGMRIHLTKVETSGEADGEAFGTHEETSTDLGGYGVLGADFFVGPGSILLEMQMGYGSVDHYILRDTNNGTLNLALGYRFFF